MLKTGNTHWSQMSHNFEVLPLTGKIREYVNQNDLVMFKLDSQDMWIKVSLQLTQENNVIDAELDLKIEKNIPLIEFDSLMQKTSLNIFNQCCQVFDTVKSSLK